MERFDERMPMSTRDHAAEWFLRLHARDLSVAERFAYLEWLKASPLHIGEIVQICYLYSVLYPMRKQLFFMNEDSLSNVIELPPRENIMPPARTKSSWHVRVAAVATAFVLTLLGVAATWDWFDPAIETQASEWRNLTLTDGSMVSVGPRTQLRHQFGEQQRLVRLARGEALFQVAKDPSRPFIVDADTAIVRATGTRFGVSRRGNDVIVTVEEGTVMVTNGKANSSGIALSAGNQVTVSENWPAQVAHVDAARALAWSNRRLVFDNETVTTAVDEFNRRNRVQIVVDPAFASMQIRGDFHADDPLTFVQTVASAKHGVAVRESGDVVRLQSLSQSSAKQ
jgi:transmembrane sensor